MKRYCIPFMGLITTLLLNGLSSCTTYHYAFINAGSREVEQNDDGDFVQEDDRVSVTYCFFGEELPIQITIRNKTERPLFVNWNESALIVEDAARTYANRKMPIRGETASTTYTYHDNISGRETISESRGQFVGETILPEGITFVPPYSKITKTPIVIDDLELNKIPNALFTKQTFETNGNSFDIRRANFTERDTPLRFKSYLTFFTTNTSGRRDRTWSQEQSFYISEMIRAKNMRPQNVDEFVHRRGDFFFVADRSNIGWLSAGFLLGTGALFAVGFTISTPDMDMSDW